MPKISRITRTEAVKLRQDLQNYLKPFLEERGMTLEFGSGKFSSYSIQFSKWKFDIPELAVPVKESFLKSQLILNGVIESSDPRTVFENTRYVVKDYKPRNYKNPWIFEDKFNKKTYKCSTDYLKRSVLN